MVKENVSINTAEKAASLIRRLDRRGELYPYIGLGHVQAGLPLEKTFRKNGIQEIVVLTADEVTEKVGIVKNDVNESMRELGRELEQTDRSMAQARRYLRRLRGKQIKLAKTSEMFVQGEITEKIFQIEKDKFDELASYAKEPSLKSGIERIKQIRQDEQIRRKKAGVRSAEPVEVFVSPSQREKFKKDLFIQPIIEAVKSATAKLFIKFKGISVEQQHSTGEIIEKNETADEDASSIQKPWWDKLESITETERACLEAHRKAGGDFRVAAKELNNSLTVKQLRMFVNSAFAKKQKVV